MLLLAPTATLMASNEMVKAQKDKIVKQKEDYDKMVLKARAALKSKDKVDTHTHTRALFYIHTQSHTHTHTHTHMPCSHFDVIPHTEIFRCHNYAHSNTPTHMDMKHMYIYHRTGVFTDCVFERALAPTS